MCFLIPVCVGSNVVFAKEHSTFFLSWAVLWAEILILEVYSQDMTQNLGSFGTAKFFWASKNVLDFFSIFLIFYSSNFEKISFF